MPATINGTTGFGGNLTGNVTGNVAGNSDTATTLSTATGSAPAFACRAWVNFNGTRNATDTGASTNGANVLIRASGNVASVLKNGTGDYTITLTTAMPDANHSIVATSIDTGLMMIHPVTPLTATSARLICVTRDSVQLQDASIVCVQVVR